MSMPFMPNNTLINNVVSVSLCVSECGRYCVGVSRCGCDWVSLCVCSRECVCECAYSFFLKHPICSRNLQKSMFLCQHQDLALDPLKKTLV